MSPRSDDAEERADFFRAKSPASVAVCVFSVCRLAHNRRKNDTVLSQSGINCGSVMILRIGLGLKKWSVGGLDNAIALLQILEVAKEVQ